MKYYKAIDIFYSEDENGLITVVDTGHNGGVRITSFDSQDTKVLQRQTRISKTDFKIAFYGVIEKIEKLGFLNPNFSKKETEDTDKEATKEINKPIAKEKSLEKEMELVYILLGKERIRNKNKFNEIQIINNRISELTDDNERVIKEREISYSLIHKLLKLLYEGRTPHDMTHEEVELSNQIRNNDLSF